MSGARFASLTGALLVRKGEAAPSPFVALAGTSVGRDPLQAQASPAYAPVPREAPQAIPREALKLPAPPLRLAKAISGGSGSPPEPPPKQRRLMVSLTTAEYETLGLIGIKKGATRHQLLRNAVDEYLALLVEEYQGECQCITTGCACK